MTRWLVAGGLALLMQCQVARAQPLELPVSVVEVSGAQAYLSHGRAHGVRAGTRVRLGKQLRRVTRASRSHAVVDARGLRVGAQGFARVLAQGKPAPQRASPRGLASFAGQWPEARVPAAQERPRAIPLGQPARAIARRVDASLSSAAAARVPLRAGESAGRVELRAQLRAALDSRLPIELKSDLALQTWLGRQATGVADGDPRPQLLARELALSIGTATDYRAELGRMRYAAANLGALDGVRLEAARLGMLSIAGFGGMLPAPISGAVDARTSRFGLELGLESERQAWSPRLNVVLQGSVHAGRLDERRIFASGRLWPGDHRLQAYAEGALFDAHNPWGRPGIELSAAGADADLRFGAVRLSARVDMRRPERSYWLADNLPRGWLCASAAAVSCAAVDDTRYLAQAAAGWLGQALALQADGLFVASSDASLGSSSLLHALVRSARPIGAFDFGLGAAFERGALLRTSLGVRADVGVSFARERARLSVYYRPDYRAYTASSRGLLEHGAGVALHLSASPELSVDLQGDARLGDVDALLGLLLVRYRARR